MRKNKYTWKDVVKVNGKITIEEFEKLNILFGSHIDFKSK